MLRPDMVESYVRDLLERMAGSRPEPDHDGDLPVTLGGATFFVRIVSPHDPIVQVFSIAVDGIEPTPALYAAMNDINSCLHFARIFYVKGQVLIESEVWGTDVNPSNLDHACKNIAAATDSFGTDLAHQFKARPWFEEAKAPDYRPPTPRPEGFGDGFGMYI